MDANDMILISVDDHLVEPPTVFDQHIPEKYRDAAPRVIRKADGSDVWTFNGSEIPNIGLNAVAGRPKEEYGVEPTAFDEMRPGCWDVDERIKDMNAGGVLAAINFPSFPGFSGRLFAAAEDKDLALAVLRAYNDWHVDEWCGAYPGRLIPQGLVPLWDAQVAADEIARLAAKGVHSVTFTENPATLGYDSFHQASWDPLWKACSDHNVVLSIHLGSSGKLAVTAPDAPVDVMITLQPMNIVQAAADLVWSTTLRRFPDLRFALSEGGIGWIPYFLERIDYNYDRHHAWTGQDFGDRLPSEVFNEHVLTCFIDDKFGMLSKDSLDMDMVTWECDYPHSDSNWPESPEIFAASVSGLSDLEIDKVGHLNAMRHFQYDPFQILGGRDNCTVGALRAQVEGHDVTIRSQKRAGQGGGSAATAAADLVKMAARSGSGT